MQVMKGGRRGRLERGLKGRGKMKRRWSWREERGRRGKGGRGGGEKRGMSGGRVDWGQS